MKKQMIVASVLVLSACAQTPTPVTAGNGKAAMAGMNCSCCQNMRGNSMPQGMTPPSDAKQCCAMCAGMQKSTMTAPATPIETPDKNPHQQHHP